MFKTLRVTKETGVNWAHTCQENDGAEPHKTKKDVLTSQ